MRHILSSLLLLLLPLIIRAQVPAVGSSKTIDFASWNLMWFGHPQNGPDDLDKQEEGVAEVIRNARIDIWCFQEVVDTQAFNAMLLKNGSFGHLYTRYWQEQRIALVWDLTKWTLLQEMQPFMPYPVDFANGRLPLVVKLFNPDTEDTVIVVGIHLKAHTGTNTEKLQSWQNRKKSVERLQNWVVGNADQPVIILGDWNDDIDESVYTDSASSIQALKENGTFLLENQSLAGMKTWVFGNSVIDHVWANPRAMHDYKANSADIFELDIYFNDYPETISDHYPVYASFHLKTPNAVESTPDATLTVYPNPSKGVVIIDDFTENMTWQCRDMHGKEVPLKGGQDGGKLILSDILPGIYLLIIQTDGEQQVHRLVVME